MNDTIDAQDLDELRAQESAILERIHALPNGGYLFLVDPLATLEMVGVRLASCAIDEIERLEPRARTPDARAFRNLVLSQADQRVTVRLSGLFRTEAPA